MENLKLQFSRSFFSKILEAKHIAFKVDSGSVNNEIYITSNTHLFSFNELNGDIESLNEIHGVVGCEYLVLQSKICVATNEGEVLTIDPSTKVVSEGTFCDVGIVVMSWSPNQEVVAFVTKTQNVVIMSSNYEPIAEHELNQKFFGEGAFIDVGWGKSETQFHGSEGKSDKTQSQNIHDTKGNCILKQDVVITWRSDASFFAVSYHSPESGRRFKIFDKEGKLHFTSEILNKLSPAISWRPSGNWIAMPHQLPHKSTVALFEKNGLRHQEIVMPFSFDIESIVNLKWSNDSKILTIQTDKNVLYLYTVSNYHWYLKQVLRFGSDAELKISVFMWDDRIDNEGTLHVLLANGTFTTYNWTFSIDKHNEAGLVAVIDGKKLFLTDFKKMVVPPPMFEQEIEIEANINSCGFISGLGDQTKLFLYDDKNNLHTFVGKSAQLGTIKKEATFQIPANNCLHSAPMLEFKHFLWLDPERMLASRLLNSKSEIVLFEISSKSLHEMNILNSYDCEELIIGLTKSTQRQNQVYINTLSGKVYLISIDAVNNNFKLIKIFNQLEQCDELQSSMNTINDIPNLITLGKKGCLYLNSNRIATGVTSFCVVADYLAYTEVSTLKFLRLDDLRIINERKIEQGGKLITVIEDDSKIVLQIPRGNIETIYSKVLLLKTIKNLLDQGQYSSATKIMRKQRINLNLLCDHNMVEFISNISKFVNEIKNGNWLNLFVADLQNEDFTKTMYANYYSDHRTIYPDGFKVEQKIAFICDKLCDEMEKSSDDCFVSTLVTTYVKMSKIEKALQIIWKYKQEEISKISNMNVSEELFRHLLYLVDVNHLYNVALGSYDLSLVLFVANKSQKDPKEFLPFINKLKTFEKNYRNYYIDNYLKRYQSALEHIAKCGEDKFDEALEFIKRHNMYQNALQVYSSVPSCYQRISLCFADYLRINGNFENASIMYERGGDLSQALQSARHILDWYRTLILAKKCGMDLESVALSLIAPLQECNRHEEAYDLDMRFRSNFPLALNILIKGKLFLKAIFEIQMHSENKDHLLNTLIKPAILDYANLLQETITTDEKLYVNHKSRLITIRENMIQEKAENDEQYDNSCREHDMLSDSISLKSSTFTGCSKNSSKTFRSSKNRRKHERKLFSLKEGSTYEDIALIDALYNHAMKIFKQQAHVHEICKALLEIHEDEFAKSIQSCYKHSLKIVQESLDDIWIPEVSRTPQSLIESNMNYLQFRNEQRYAMLDPLKRLKPPIKIIKWEHEILCST